MRNTEGAVVAFPELILPIPEAGVTFPYVEKLPVSVEEFQRKAPSDAFPVTLQWMLLTVATRAGKAVRLRPPGAVRAKNVTLSWSSLGGAVTFSTTWPSGLAKTIW